MEEVKNLIKLEDDIIQLCRKHKYKYNKIELEISNSFRIYNGNFLIYINESWMTIEEFCYYLNNNDDYFEDDSDLISEICGEKCNFTNIFCKIDSQHSTCGIICLHNFSYNNRNYSINTHKLYFEILFLIFRFMGYGAIIINHTLNSKVSNLLKEIDGFKIVNEVENPRTDNVILTFMKNF